MSDNEKNKTAAEYRAEADKLRKQLKEYNRTFIKTGLIIVAVVAVIFIASVAWFVNNISVKNTGVKVSVKNEVLFELATLKDSSIQGVYDANTDGNSKLVEVLKKNYQKAYNNFFGLPSFSVGETEYIYNDKKYIIGDADGISLMVNETSNINNNQDELQLGPGSRGQFTFYIIPKSDDLDDLTVTITLRGYTVEESTNEEGSKDGKVVELDNSSLTDDEKLHLINCICGHILLFKGIDDNGNYSDQLVPSLNDNKIVFTLSSISGFENGVPFPVTVYWIWPRQFEGMIVPGINESVFKSSCDEQNKIISFLNDNKKYVYFLTDGLENFSVAEITNGQLMSWSKAYNRGDQLIGNHVALFSWVIDAFNE